MDDRPHFRTSIKMLVLLVSLRWATGHFAHVGVEAPSSTRNQVTPLSPASRRVRVNRHSAHPGTTLDRLLVRLGKVLTLALRVWDLWERIHGR